MDLRLAFTALAAAAAKFSTKRAVIVLVLTGIVAVAGALFAVRLAPSAGIETLVGSSSKTYQETQAYAKQFGDDPIVILVKGDLPKMVLSPDLAALAGLEGCVSGNAPEKELKDPETPRPCKLMARNDYVQAVYGPGTFVNTAALSVNGEIDSALKKAKRTSDRAANAAQRVAAAKGLPLAEQEKLANDARTVAGYNTVNELIKLGAQYGIGFSNRPKLDNGEFVSRLIFDATRGYNVPKSRFSYLFPNKNSALIQVRLRQGLTADQRREAVGLVRAAARDERFLIKHGNYTVTGAPVVLAGVEDAVKRAAVLLIIAALLVMGLTLLFVFPAELRLLPLVIAMMATAILFGGLALTGGGLGVGAIAVIPVLIGLAVDYAIQFQYRVEHERQRASAAEPDADNATSATDGAVDAGAIAQANAVLAGARGAAPSVFTAAFATLAALLALLLSSVPLVRGFGLMLAAGVAIALLLVLTTGFAALGWAGGSPITRKPRQPARGVARKLHLFAAIEKLASRGTRAFTILLVLAIGGWVLAAFGPVKTDLRDLASGNVQAVKDIEKLQKVAGTSGEVAVLVRAKDVTDKKVLDWMAKYQRQVLADAGYKGERPQCVKAQLCPALSLTDLLGGKALNQAAINELLRTVPDYAKALISEDRTLGNMAFGIRLQSLSDQRKLIENMRSRLNPPDGVTAEVVGLSALAADASGRLGAPWRRLAIPGGALLLVLLVMVAVLRSARKAAVPVLTVLIAGGLSSLLLALTRIELNPLSATLNVFVIAIATEFTALVYMQYLREQERQPGTEIVAAYRNALRTTGPALFASGATALAGFATLAISSIGLLRGFAVVAVVDLTAALIGALLLLPLVTIAVEARKGVRGSK